MPEVVTQYPQIVRKLLRQEGIACGEGESPQILTACPSENFCSLSGGELCVYGLGEVPQMTQIGPRDLAPYAADVAVALSAWEAALAAGALVIVALGVGLALGRRQRQPPSG
jgi:hypothetical protein